MPPPPPDVDEEMAEAMMDEGRPQVQILAGMQCRPYIRFMMEMDDRLCALLVEEGVRPKTVRDIRADPRLLDL